MPNLSNASYDLSFLKPGKVEVTPSMLMEKEKYIAHTNWMNEFELKCTIDYNNKKVATICRIKDAELQF